MAIGVTVKNVKQYTETKCTETFFYQRNAGAGHLTRVKMLFQD